MPTLPKFLLAALMIGTALPAAAATALGAPTAPAAAPMAKGTPNSQDVRCLMTMVALANNKDRQQQAQVGIYFFAGRLSARAPTFDLAGAMRAQAPTLGPQQLQAELQRCGPMIAKASQSVQGGLAGLRPAGAPAPSAAPAPAPAQGPVAPAPK